VTAPINARNLVLTVPLHSWVEKGQVIGQADFEPAPEQIGQARNAVDAASAAVVEEQNRIHEIDEDLADAHAEAATRSSQWFASETAKVDAEREFERSSELYREGLESQTDYEAARSALDLADSAVATDREHTTDMADRISELDVRAVVAQQALNKAVARSGRIQAVANQAEERGGCAPVVAPADGLILEGDAGTGTFGIAADPNRLSVAVLVSEANLASLRVGQPAIVTLVDRPNIAFDATLSAIDETPLDSPNGALYRITFSVMNAKREQLAGIPVRVRLAQMLP
jgi:multidrug resistance efflux pump